MHIAEEHLSTDPRWPLNWPIAKEMLEKDLTAGQCGNLLSTKYNLTLSPGATLLPVDNDTIVWHSSNAADMKMRDLLLSIVRVAHKPGMLYFARVSPNHDPRTGYAGLADRQALKWVLNLPQSTTVDSANKLMQIQRKVEFPEMSGAGHFPKNSTESRENK